MLSSTASDNLACTDEVKVYEDEGEEEEQQKSSENLTEDKVRLVIESETQVFYVVLLLIVLKAKNIMMFCLAYTQFLC
ncbi:hypothetical protein Smp_016680 [Schistosoma mansoni]|uniref:hypothetical protein n=1 Tax=Schistosoma mansoni TaxID=6183 RepID=UPI0001A63435|nr:hypothetical protein Smp_016680 [Schistosoma mansoni]|eukprot:XP_018653367.1 hypothetical protein Smp_016680 [Schistosoma mansoni]